jgi:hypothetical protein
MREATSLEGCVAENMAAAASDEVLDFFFLSVLPIMVAIQVTNKVQ